MNDEILYSDKLVEVTSDTILFRVYYFPFGKKQFNWSDIESIEITEPTLLNGKYRIHGSGDFKTWFPRDGKRPTREKIFIINLHNKRRRIGFTVENTVKVITIFKSKELLKDS
jgi:hypothetical protein